MGATASLRAILACTLMLRVGSACPMAATALLWATLACGAPCSVPRDLGRLTAPVLKSCHKRSVPVLVDVSDINVFAKSSSIFCTQILASIGQLEFFYDQAPDVMRSCSMALQLLSVAIGSYLSGALVSDSRAVRVNEMRIQVVLEAHGVCSYQVCNDDNA